MANDSGVVSAIIVVAALGLLMYAVWSYNCHRSKDTENFAPPYGPDSNVAFPMDPATSTYKPVDFQKQVDDSLSPADCFPKDRLSAEDLLPRDAANSKWAQVNPAGQGDVGDQNFLTASHHQGIDTIGASMRNSNLTIRSEPPNPRARVSVWNESTIEPDLNRRPFEIDGTCA